MTGKNDEGEFNVLDLLQVVAFVLLVIINVWQNNKIQNLEKRVEALEIKVVSLEEYREGTVNTFKVLKDVLEDYESIKSAS